MNPVEMTVSGAAAVAIVSACVTHTAGPELYSSFLNVLNLFLKKHPCVLICRLTVVI